MRRVAILGSTGSIGTQTLDVIRSLPQQFQVVGLAARKDGEFLSRQAAEFGVRKTVLFDEAAAKVFGHAGGMAAMVDLATDPEVDIVVVSVAGVIGLEATLAAIEAGKTIALASKEVLVAAGEIVIPLVETCGSKLLPIDSEHSAIFQCLQGPCDASLLDSILLTASGGPFLGKTRAELESVTVSQALNHPTWSMGGKITVDSASLMNKALEMIEARWLFGVTMDQVEVVVHPQSIIHSFVRFKDGSMLGQMGVPNMRMPIQYALTYPDRISTSLPTYDPAAHGPLTFLPVDHDTFPALRMARKADALGGTAPAAFNAANEEAVRLFLEEKLPFLGIFDVVDQVLDEHSVRSASLPSILETDSWARETVREKVAYGKVHIR